MNRRLFRIQSCLCGDTFPVVVTGKAESVAVAVQSHIVVGEHRSRGDLPVIFSWNGHILDYVSHAVRLVLSGLAALSRSSSVPFVPMTQSTLPNNSDNHLFLLFSAPLRSVAPFGTTSPSCKRLPHRLCVAKSGERSAERYHNLKASADHRLASCAAMQGFQPL